MLSKGENDCDIRAGQSVGKKDKNDCDVRECQSVGKRGRIIMTSEPENSMLNIADILRFYV